MNQTTLPLPNPQEWYDITQTLEALRVHRSTLYVMIDDGRVTRHRVGKVALFWRPEVDALAAALEATRPRSGA